MDHNDNNQQNPQRAQKKQPPERQELSAAAMPIPENSAPKMRMKSDISFDHTLVKLDVAPMKKYVGYKKVAVRSELVDTEHVHWFHSHNDAGKAQSRSNEVGGHYHEVSVDWTRSDAEGNPVIVVGPPLMKERKMNGRGVMVTNVVPVKYLVEDDSGNPVDFVDNHRHQPKYMWTERLKPKVRQAGFVSMQAPAQPKSEDGAVIAEV